VWRPQGGNWDQRSVVYVRHRTLNTADAPGPFPFIPEPQSRYLTITWHAASVTPDPIDYRIASEPRGTVKRMAFNHESSSPGPAAEVGMGDRLLILV